MWVALRKTGHLDDRPGKSLELRLERMRAWIEGPHFPDDEKIHVRRPEEQSFEGLNEDQVLFLSALAMDLEYSNWTSEAIEECIRKSISEMKIANKDAYAAIYWAILAKLRGPRASSLLSELDRGMVLKILNPDREPE